MAATHGRPWIRQGNDWGECIAPGGAYPSLELDFCGPSHIGAQDAKLFKPHIPDRIVREKREYQELSGVPYKPTREKAPLYSMGSTEPRRMAAANLARTYNNFSGVNIEASSGTMCLRDAMAYNKPRHYNPSVNVSLV